MSGRLEEIPGEEAFPAYLESYIAAFYERAGRVRLPDGSIGSVTIGGTVSPAGGNFEEPVTQATLKVVGAFHGLSRERSDARKYPAIDPLISWSKYGSVIDAKKSELCKSVLFEGDEIGSMMKVVGEEGTSIPDYVTYLKAEMLDSVYLQQNSFDEVDANCTTQRQRYVTDKLIHVLGSDFSLESKDDARNFFNRMRQKFIDFNYTEFESDAFKKAEKEIFELYNEGNGKLTVAAELLLKDGE
jgi:V/A-type H+-transporting ATPase subunit A